MPAAVRVGGGIVIQVAVWIYYCLVRYLHFINIADKRAATLRLIQSPNWVAQSANCVQNGYYVRLRVYLIMHLPMTRPVAPHYLLRIIL